MISISYSGAMRKPLTALDIALIVAGTAAILGTILVIFVPKVVDFSWLLFLYVAIILGLLIHD